MNRLEHNEIFANNMKEQRKRLGYTQEQMAEAIEMSFATYKSLEKDHPESIGISIFQLENASRVTGLSLFELMGYPETPAVMCYNFCFHLSKRAQKIIQHYIVTEKELLKGQRFSKMNDPNYLLCYVPTGEMKDDMYLDSNDVEFIDVSNIDKRTIDRVDFGIRITSNNFHPIYHIDDILLVSGDQPHDGQTGIFIENETKKMYIRKFHAGTVCELKPITGNKKPILVPRAEFDEMNKWTKFGTVVTRLDDGIVEYANES